MCAAINDSTVDVSKKGAALTAAAAGDFAHLPIFDRAIECSSRERIRAIQHGPQVVVGLIVQVADHSEIDGAGQPARMDVILRQLARLHAFTVLSGGGVALENTAFPFIVAQKAGPAKGAKNASAQQRCQTCQRSHFAALQSGFLKRFGGPQPSELYSESSDICGGFGNLARFPCAYAADGEACGEA